MDHQRTESYRLLALIQDRAEPETVRMAAFSEMLELTRGFWLRSEDSHDATLKGFVSQVCAKVVEQAVSDGARRVALDAEDLTHEVLLTFFDKAHLILTNPRSWLIGVAIRKMKGTLRREGHYLFGKRLDDVAEPEARRRPTRSLTVAKRRLLRRAISGLSPNARAVLRAHAAGKTTEEIARQLQISAPAVRQRLSRAKRTLHEQLAAKRKKPRSV